jgi:hypothetical protein
MQVAHPPDEFGIRLVSPKSNSPSSAQRRVHAGAQKANSYHESFLPS